MGKQWNSFPKQSFLMMSWRQNDLAQLNPQIGGIPVPLTSMTFLSVMCSLCGGSDNTGRNGEVMKICVSRVSRAGSLWWLLVNQNQNKSHSIGESRKIFDLIFDFLKRMSSGKWDPSLISPQVLESCLFRQTMTHQSKGLMPVYHVEFKGSATFRVAFWWLINEDLSYFSVIVW